MSEFEMYPNNERLITIGALTDSVADQTGMQCTPQMINNYERHGLIQHSAKTKGGFRLFKIKDIHTVICIKQLQSEGYSLEKIKTILAECVDQNEFDASALLLPEDRRLNILKAAAKVFPQKGYELTTLQDIADEANISNTLIYQYFDNKEDLFLAFVKNISYTNILRKIETALIHTEVIDYKQVRETIIELSTVYLRELTNNAEYFRMIIGSGAKFPNICNIQVGTFVAPIEISIEKYFDHLIKIGLFREVNPKLAMRMYVGIWVNIVVLRNLLFGNKIMEVPAEEEIENFVDLFLRSVLKDPPE